MSWRLYKKALIERYAEDISRSVLKQNSNSLLIAAVLSDNQNLFDEICESVYLNEAYNEIDSKGNSALKYAVLKCNRMFEKMISYGIDNWAPDENGNPLMLGAYIDFVNHLDSYTLSERIFLSRRFLETVQEIKRINYETDLGETFLTTAIQANDKEMVQLLLQKKANIFAGHTPIQNDRLNAFETALYYKRIDMICDFKECDYLSKDELKQSLLKVKKLHCHKTYIIDELKSYLFVCGIVGVALLSCYCLNGFSLKLPENKNMHSKQIQREQIPVKLQKNASFYQRS